MALKLSLAPIQGITDFHFRNAFSKHFGDIDNYYAPYLRVDKKKEVKASKFKDILPENNLGIHVIPQIMVKTANDFIVLAEKLTNLGYTEINWNLGCPYPMVTNRKLGSGLLPHHDLILTILEKVFSHLKVRISIKMRTGLTDDKEIEKLLPKFNDFPLSEIIIHPRYAKQLYKEKANLDIFNTCITLSKHKVCYNGDINSLETFRNYAENLNTTEHFMLGRGIISNPFLASQIKANNNALSGTETEIFKAFHNELFESYLNSLSGTSHILPRMKAFWEYFSLSFSNSHKAFKKIKKATSIDKYNNAVKEIFNEYVWVNFNV